MFEIRLAAASDLPALAALIPASVRTLGAGHYTPEQIESAIRHVFGPDTQLIADGTYLVAEAGAALIGCGGWSRRRTLYGGDQAKGGADPLLDPAADAGFSQLELVATLPGERLYRTLGFVSRERYDVPLPDGLGLPVVRMVRAAAEPGAGGGR
jgi:hypothetical protein